MALERDDDSRTGNGSTVKGSRNKQWVCWPKSGMTKFWSEEKPVGTENDLFRVKVVGSIPAGPTTLPFNIVFLFLDLNILLLEYFQST